MSKYLENTYRGKRVLITGHTGFKGSWLSLWLTMLGAKVYGVSLDPCGDLNSFSAIASSLEINDFRHDIRDGPGLNNLVSQIKPDFVFHLAAQALVGSSYVDPVATYTTNTNLTAPTGTVKLRVILVCNFQPLIIPGEILEKYASSKHLNP